MSTHGHQYRHTHISSAIDINTDAGVDAVGAVVSNGFYGCRRSALYRRVALKRACGTRSICADASIF
jgi:hypothetical protein